MGLRRQGRQCSTKLDQITIAIFPLLKQVEITNDVPDRRHILILSSPGSRQAPVIYTLTRTGFLASFSRQVETGN